MTTTANSAYFSGPHLVDTLVKSYGRPVGELLRQRRGDAVLWTQTGTRIAGRQALHAFGGFFIELAQDYAEIQHNHAAIETHRLSQELRDWRHDSGLALADKVLRESIAHRARSIKIIEGFRVHMRAEKDIEAYRMLSDALREINLLGDAHWRRDFDKMYKKHTQIPA